MGCCTRGGRVLDGGIFPFPETKDKVVHASDLESYMGLTMEQIGEGLLPDLSKEKREEIMCYAIGLRKCLSCGASGKLLS